MKALRRTALATIAVLSGCTGGPGCPGYSHQRFKEICERRTMELQLHNDSDYQAVLRNCLRSVEPESARAIESRMQYKSIINKAISDQSLKQEYESEKRKWEDEEALRLKEWQSEKLNSRFEERKGSGEYNLYGVPPLDLQKRAKYSSYVAWLANGKFKKEIEATGWNSIASDMKVFAEEAKCK